MSGKSVLMHTVRLKNLPAKGQKRMATKDTAIGLCISRRGAEEIYIDFTEELNHAETNPMCSIH